MTDLGNTDAALSWKDGIDATKVPSHIAIIMDGNGRWAQRQGEERIFGHRNAVDAVRSAAEACAEIGVKHLTLYAFSTENWGRPAEEVAGLMQLFVHTIRQEIDTLKDNKIRLGSIGDISGLPESCQLELAEAKAITGTNTGLHLVLALNYSGRSELLRAARQLVAEAEAGLLHAAELTEARLAGYLDTASMPDPELLIRTSGEMRVSNFLLWQLAYTELYITNTLWPDFSKNTLAEAIKSYQGRERRFGKL
jgi:undecaprenyl diphosphate synthase